VGGIMLVGGPAAGVAAIAGIVFTALSHWWWLLAVPGGIVGGILVHFLGLSLLFYGDDVRRSPGPASPCR